MLNTNTILIFFSSTNIGVVIDIVALIVIVVLIIKVIRDYHIIKNNHIFSELSQSAEIPLFLIDSKKQLYWTNLNNVSYLSHANHQRALSLFLADENAVNKLEECFRTGKSQHIEKKFKFEGHTFWFHITMAKIKTKNLVSGFMSDITELKSATEKIDNQQREMQMQNEMLSIITAQHPQSR